jgi:hypothetical protein
MLIFCRWKYRWYKDTRTWHQRIHRAHANWATVMDHLIEAYLKWKHPSAAQPTSTLPTQPLAESETYDFTIEVVDIYSL